MFVLLAFNSDLVLLFVKITLRNLGQVTGGTQDGQDTARSWQMYLIFQGAAGLW